MNQIQNVSFRNINDFLDYLPEHELRIVEALRNLVFECITEVKEKLSYNVPYYYRHSRICFIWPGSVPWGKKLKEGVEFGFCKGDQLSDPSYLDIGNRKEVYIKTFNTVKEIDWECMRQLIFEATIIDAETAKRSRV